MEISKRISIHAPRTGSDKFLFFVSSIRCYFNPRSPHGERLPRYNDLRHRRISIHAPRTGSDVHRFHLHALLSYVYFNPRSPHGERHRRLAEFCYRTQFQSTLPARGATMKISRMDSVALISIHAPRTGSDMKTIKLSTKALISIHAPRTGSDTNANKSGIIYVYFNPRSPHGERP